MNNKGSIVKLVFGCIDAVISNTQKLHHETNHNSRVMGIFLCLIMLLGLAFRPASASETSAPGNDASAAAPMYMLTTGDAGGQANADEVYVALAGDRARIYQRGSGSNAVFALGAFPVSNNGHRLEVSISEQNRREARERVAQTLETIASKIAASSATSPIHAPIAGLDSRLGNIQMFFDSALMDDMAVTEALAAFDDNTMRATLNQIQDLKKAYILEDTHSGDRQADRMRIKDSLRAPVTQLLMHENIRRVFYEKEMLGSILRDMDAVDREIADCYVDGARIAREGSTGHDQAVAIEETAAKLEHLERLSAAAAHLEQQYTRFMTVTGFEENGTAPDQGVASAWNAILWESMTACFAPEDILQYEIQSAVCRPLDRLAAHCCMAGDAARALRTLKALDNLARPAGGNTRISLERTSAAWTDSERHITLQPVMDSDLTDWRMWEQWANRVDQRI